VPALEAGGGNGVVDQLKSEGRARLYGILFDTDSDHLKDESKPTLGFADCCGSHAAGVELRDRRIYTDNVGGDAHNQTLSEKRAALSEGLPGGAGVDASG
jgi:outer membrane protein OmpA-like peptidoglycan-associated protein